jgi:hypothetical protein
MSRMNNPWKDRTLFPLTEERLLHSFEDCLGNDVFDGEMFLGLGPDSDKNEEEQEKNDQEGFDIGAVGQLFSEEWIREDWRN